MMLVLVGLMLVDIAVRPAKHPASHVLGLASNGLLIFTLMISLFCVPSNLLGLDAQVGAATAGSLSLQTALQMHTVGCRRTPLSSPRVTHRHMEALRAPFLLP